MQEHNYTAANILFLFNLNKTARFVQTNI